MLLLFGVPCWAYARTKNGAPYSLSLSFSLLLTDYVGLISLRVQDLQIAFAVNEYINCIRTLWVSPRKKIAANDVSIRLSPKDQHFFSHLSFSLLNLFWKTWYNFFHFNLSRFSLPSLSFLTLLPDFPVLFCRYKPNSVLLPNGMEIFSNEKRKKTVWYKESCKYIIRIEKYESERKKQRSDG